MVIVLAVEDSAAAAIASVEAALAAAEDSVDSVAAAGSEDAVAGSGADDNNLGLGFASNFSYNQKLNQPTKNKTYEKTININRHRQYRNGPGAISSVSDHHWYRRCHGPERGLAHAVRF